MGQENMPVTKNGSQKKKLHKKIQLKFELFNIISSIQHITSTFY